MQAHKMSKRLDVLKALLTEYMPLVEYTIAYLEKRDNPLITQYLSSVKKAFNFLKLNSKVCNVHAYQKTLLKVSVFLNKIITGQRKKSTISKFDDLVFKVAAFKYKLQSLEEGTPSNKNRFKRKRGKKKTNKKRQCGKISKPLPLSKDNMARSINVVNSNDQEVQSNRSSVSASTSSDIDQTKSHYKSLREKLIEDIKTVHKVGVSFGGALRILASKSAEAKGGLPNQDCSRVQEKISLKDPTKTVTEDVSQKKNTRQKQSKPCKNDMVLPKNKKSSSPKAVNQRKLKSDQPYQKKTGPSSAKKQDAKMRCVKTNGAVARAAKATCGYNSGQQLQKNGRQKSSIKADGTDNFMSPLQNLYEPPEGNIDALRKFKIPKLNQKTKDQEQTANGETDNKFDNCTDQTGSLNSTHENIGSSESKPSTSSSDKLAQKIANEVLDVLKMNTSDLSKDALLSKIKSVLIETNGGTSQTPNVIDSTHTYSSGNDSINNTEDISKTESTCSKNCDKNSTGICESELEVKQSVCENNLQENSSVIDTSTSEKPKSKLLNSLESSLEPCVIDPDKKLHHGVEGSSQHNNIPEQIPKENINVNEKSYEQVVPKKKMTHKCELDRLHDDINNMFIANDILKAYGTRKCKIKNYVNESCSQNKSCQSRKLTKKILKPAGDVSGIKATKNKKKKTKRSAWSHGVFTRRFQKKCKNKNTAEDNLSDMNNINVADNKTLNDLNDKEIDCENAYEKSDDTGNDWQFNDDFNNDELYVKIVNQIDIKYNNIYGENFMCNDIYIKKEKDLHSLNDYTSNNENISEVNQSGCQKNSLCTESIVIREPPCIKREVVEDGLNYDVFTESLSDFGLTSSNNCKVWKMKNICIPFYKENAYKTSTIENIKEHVDIHLSSFGMDYFHKKSFDLSSVVINDKAIEKRQVPKGKLGSPKVIVGPFKVITMNDVLVYMCTIVDCMFMTHDDKIISDHVEVCHKHIKWNWSCSVCSVITLPNTVGIGLDLSLAVEHMIQNHSIKNILYTEAKKLNANKVLNLDHFSGASINTTGILNVDKGNYYAIHPPNVSELGEETMIPTETEEVSISYFKETFCENFDENEECIKSSDSNNMGLKIDKVLCLNPKFPEGIKSLQEIAKTGGAHGVSNGRVFTIPIPVLKEYEDLSEIASKRTITDFFKCFGKNCEFTSNSYALSKTHFSDHELQNDYDKSWQLCVYCSKEFKTSELLTSHLVLEHGNSIYQCPYCYYRSVSCFNIGLHQIQEHNVKNVGILKCEVPRCAFSATCVFNQSNLLIPYTCNFKTCGARTYIPDHFIKHLNKVHSKRTKYTCILCKYVAAGPQSMIEHYEVHNVFKYQCRYCIFGSSDVHYIQKHLALNHPSKIPKAILRELCSRHVSKLAEEYQLSSHETGLEILAELDFETPDTESSYRVYPVPFTEDEFNEIIDCTSESHTVDNISYTIVHDKTLANCEVSLYQRLALLKSKAMDLEINSRESRKPQSYKRKEESIKEDNKTKKVKDSSFSELINSPAPTIICISDSENEEPTTETLFEKTTKPTEIEEQRNTDSPDHSSLNTIIVISDDENEDNINVNGSKQTISDNHDSLLNLDDDEEDSPFRQRFSLNCLSYDITDSVDDVDAVPSKSCKIYIDRCQAKEYAKWKRIQKVSMNGQNKGKPFRRK